MVSPGRLRAVELFAGLTDEQLRWLATQGSRRGLADGTVLFEDGEEGAYFYVLLSGELLITKVIDGQENVMSRHVAHPGGPGPDGKPSAANQFTGELPMLVGGGYVAKGTAVGRTELIAYDRSTFFAILARCPQVCQVLLPVLAWRIRSYERLSGRGALLEGLTTMVAGLMHELYNPVAAAIRAAGELTATTPSLIDWAVRWGQEATPADRVALARMTIRDCPGDATLGSEIAGEITDILAGRGVPSPAELALVLADYGVDPGQLAALGVRPQSFEAAVSFLAYSLQVRELAAEAHEASRRVAGLVESARTFANAGRTPRQEADITEGLEATLVMHAAKLSGITVLRDYAKVPPVPGNPAELNQVWGNLIDNAADAMDGRGELRLRVFRETGSAVIEIGDNGPGIPADKLSRLFQPFFSTKDIGRGTGLGLYLSRDIVVHRHHGSIDVTSVPGDTRFSVRLPLVSTVTAWSGHGLGLGSPPTARS